MIAPSNPGQILPLYKNRLGNVSTYHDGYGVLASNKNFIPFHVEFMEDQPTQGSATVVTLLAVNGGTNYIFPSGAIRKFSTDDSEILFYDGSTLASAIPCGKYELYIEASGRKRYSEIINVKDLTCGYERAGLSLDDTQTQVIASDVSTSPVLSSSFEFRTDGEWTTAALPFAPQFGESYTFRRRIRTACGSHTALYTYDGGLTLRTPLPDPGSVYWSLTIENDQNANRILYGEGYRKRFYFLGPIAGPEFDDSPDYLENGRGELFLKYAQTRDLITVVATGVSDAVLSGLYEGKYHTATLQRIGDSNALITEGYEIAVSPAANDSFNTVALTFLRAVYTSQHCEPEFNATEI